MLTVDESAPSRCVRVVTNSKSASENGAFIEAYNENAKPFAWAKSEVYQKRLKPCFADQ
jgi:hypothetical protein